MPATAGRVRMPANNRIPSSIALQTHPIWQSVIRYDPYAPSKDSNPKAAASANTEESVAQNAHARYQELLALARLKSSTPGETVPGACKRCGRIGHLAFQCRNFLSVKEKEDPDKENGDKDKSAVGSSSEESSDSEYDSEMERLIAKKYYGKKVIGKTKASEEEDSDSDGKKKKKKRRRRDMLKKRTSRQKDVTDSETEDEGKKGKEKKRSGRKHEVHGHGRSRKGKKRRRISDEHSSEDSSSRDGKSKLQQGRAGSQRFR